MKTLAGKTAFVTGAASGIGLGIATALAQAGVKVMLCDIEEAALAEAVAGLKATNADVDGVRAESRSGANRSRRRGHGRALRSGPHPGEQRRRRRRRALWVVDPGGVGLADRCAVAVIWGIEVFGPLIEQHGEGGHIVSTASIAGLTSGSSSPYSVTKYGVVALSEGLRRELAPRGIGVSVLCPGLVRTAHRQLGTQPAAPLRGRHPFELRRDRGRNSACSAR